QVLALDEVHRQVDLARDLTGIEHRHQVAVRQPDDHLGLVTETLQVLLVRQVREHRLDDTELRAVLGAGQGEVQRSHAAPGERLQQCVRSEPAGELVHVSLPLRRWALRWCRAQTGRGPKGFIILLRWGSYQVESPTITSAPPNPDTTSSRGLNKFRAP